MAGEGGAIDLAGALSQLDAPYRPSVVGYYNDNKIVVVKVLGEFVWHSHADTDDLFLVLSGRMTIQLRGGADVELEAGQLFVVPAGVEHRPRAEEECHVLLVEPRGTVNTGDAGGPMTVAEPEL